MNRLCSSCTLTLTARAMWFHIVTGVLESEDRLLFVPVLPQNQCSLSYDGSLISLVGMLQVFVRLMTQISCGLADSSLEIALIGFTFDRHLCFHKRIHLRSRLCGCRHVCCHVCRHDSMPHSYLAMGRLRSFVTCYSATG